MEKHSESVLILDSRDRWYNADWLALIAQRLAFERVRDVLDVGCGVGHWSRQMASLLPAGFAVTGIDREPAWVQRAAERSRSDRGAFRFLQADALALPFADASFDLVTSQTVLMHLGDPKRALREMVRVLRPGGVLLAAEPNNAATLMGRVWSDPGTDIDSALDFMRTYMTCERGKALLGLGFSSLGEALVGELRALGLAHVSAWVNDKCDVFAPPYQTEDEQLALREEDDYEARGLCIWPRDEMKRYFIAGDGAESEFDAAYERARVVWYGRMHRAKSGAYASTGGTLQYLIAGRKAS